MTPYIAAITPACTCDCCPEDEPRAGCASLRPTCRAAATLRGLKSVLRIGVYRADFDNDIAGWEAQGELLRQIEALGGDGGQVGPYPDGRQVEVKPTSWVQLARDAGVPEEARHVDGNWPAEHLYEHRRVVLGAFNAARGGER